MNALEQYLKDHRINPVVALDALQDHGIVSDLAITAADVASEDCVRAIQFLEHERKTLAGGF